MVDKQMLSENIPTKLFNALTHHDGATPDHTSETEALADIETLAAYVAAAQADIVYLNDAAADADYEPALVNQTIILKEYNDEDIQLPATTGSGVVIRIVNLDAALFLIIPATGDAIQGSAGDATWDVPAKASVTLMDYAEGFWAVLASHGAVIETVV